MPRYTPSSPQAGMQDDQSDTSRDTREEVERSLGALPRDRFGYEQARHLLWRAGFGGSDAQVRTLVSWGPEKAVDALMDFGPGSRTPAFEPPRADGFDKDIMRPLSEEERRSLRAAQRAQDEDALARYRKMRQDAEQADRRQMGEIQKWWLRRMIETHAPMEEKLTLFWHGHFATSYRTIENSYHMYVQNQTLRKHCAGSFAELLSAMVRDPALIAYLDNNDSRKDRPNENLAREIMELFALGVGNYSEQDIKEGARALTGYTFEDDDFVFRERNHDGGSKTILGEKGHWNGDDFVRIILSKKACARFVMRRLYNFLVSDVPPDERGGDKVLDATRREVVRELGDMLYARQYQLRPVLRRLLLSRHFYDPSHINQQIKSPVVLVVGAARSLNVPARDLAILNDALDLMGQRIFFPPSVKGWDGGRAWINTSTLFVRQNILAFMIAGKKPVGYDATADSERYDPMRLLDPLDTPDARTHPDAVVRHVLRIALGWVPDRVALTLREYLRREGDVIDQRTITGLVLLASSTPEYQLC